MTAAPDPVRRGEVRASTRQGGETRILLSPITTGSTTGFLGTADLEPGEYVSEHIHPYSDEMLYVVRGMLLVDIDGRRVTLETDDALMVPRTTPHRLTNAGGERASIVFHIGPLAPSPELGHVETEPVPQPEGAPPLVGGPR